MENFIQTFSGVDFWFLDPTEDMVKIEDIAHSLSMQCRYNGHIKHFYSVAEHCVNCSLLVDPEFALQALLHDASEAYLSDLPSPVKLNLPEYYKLESVVTAAIARKFGLPPEKEWSKQVKEADKRMLIAEALKLMPNPGEWVTHDEFKSIYDDIQIPVFGLMPHEAEQFYLTRFNQLTVSGCGSSYYGGLQNAHLEMA